MKTYDEKLLMAAVKITSAVAEEAEISMDGEGVSTAAAFVRGLYDALACDDEQKDKTGGSFEIYLDSAGKYRFRMKAANGEVIASSQGYTDIRSCRNGVACVQKYAALAEIKEPAE